MNSVKLLDKIDTIFMNSENSETSDPHGCYSIFQIK